MFWTLGERGGAWRKNIKETKGVDVCPCFISIWGGAAKKESGLRGGVEFDFGTFELKSTSNVPKCQGHSMYNFSSDIILKNCIYMLYMENEVYA